MSQAFFNNCMNNQLDEAKALYAAGGIDLGFQDPGKRTPLAMAAARGHAQVVKWLLELGSPLEVRNNDGRTALCLAALKGSLEIMNLLLDAGADVNGADENGKTVFMEACDNKQEAAAMLLLERGADAHCRNKAGTSMLSHAVRSGYVKAVETLLEKGAAVNEMDTYGYTPLAHALKLRQTQLTDMLMEHGADVNYAPDGKAPVIFPMIADHNKAAVIWLLEHGADPTRKNRDGDVIDALKRYGYQDLVAQAQETAAKFAAAAPAPSVVQPAAPQPVQAVTPQPPVQQPAAPSPVQAALQQAQAAPVLSPVQAAMQKAQSAAALSPVQAAMQQVKTAEPLPAAPAYPQDPQARNMLFFDLCRTGKLEEAKLLYADGGIDAAFQDPGRRTALYMVSGTPGMDEMLAWLIRIGSPLETPGNDDKTPLGRAASRGLPDYVQTLLQAGASPDTRDQNQSTPLLEAMKEKQYDAAVAMTESGADVNAADRWGHTALLYALEQGRREEAIYFVVKGANPNAMDASSRTPLFFALKAGDYELAQVLLNYGALPNYTQKNSMGFQQPPVLFTLIKENCHDGAQWLLANGASCSETDGRGNDGFAALHEKGWDDLAGLARQLQQNAAQAVAEGAFDPQPRIQEGITSLAKAVEHKDAAMVRWYLQQGESPDEIVDWYGEQRPLLAGAIRHGIDAQIIRLLVEEGGADVNLKYAEDRGGDPVKSYMDAAIHSGRVETVLFLLDHGFDLNDEPVSNTGIIPRGVWLEEVLNRYAFEKNDQEMLTLVQAFLDHGQIVNTTVLRNLRYCQPSDDIGVLRKLFTMLIDRCADVNEPFDRNETLLYHYLNDYPENEYNNRKFEIVVDLLLSRSEIDLQVRTDYDSTPLFAAVRNKDCPAAIVRRLLGLGADANEICGDVAVLTAAVTGNSPDKLTALLEFGADANAVVDKNGHAPLHYACGMEAIPNGKRKTAFDVVPVLLARGADPNQADNTGNTALHYLVLDNTPDAQKTVQLLLEKGADIGALNQYLRTPFFACAIATNGQFRNVLQPMQKLLLANGAQPDSQDINGKTPLHFAVSNDDANQIRFLLDAGADPELADNEGTTPYKLALQKNTRSIVSMIEKKCATLKLDEDDMDAAFFKACKGGKRGVAEMLLKRGNIDVTYTDDRGRGCLYYVAEQGMLPLAKILVAQGVDINAADRNGRTALHAAASSRQREMVKLLLENGADQDMRDNEGILPVHLVTNRGQHDLLAVLLENGADANLMTNDGETLLLTACYARSRECARLLLEKGADANIADNAGITPVFIAVRNNQKDLLALLCEHNADINASDKDGDQPIHMAAIHGFKDMIRELAARGADVNALNHYGYAPLHIVTRDGNKDIFKYLLDLGADFALKTSEGRSCMDIATANNQKEIIELIAVYQHRREVLEQ